MKGFYSCKGADQEVTLGEKHVGCCKVTFPSRVSGGSQAGDLLVLLRRFLIAGWRLHFWKSRNDSQVSV